MKKRETANQQNKSLLKTLKRSLTSSGPSSDGVWVKAALGSKATVVVRRWGSYTQKLITVADVSSVRPSESESGNCCKRLYEILNADVSRGLSIKSHETSYFLLVRVAAGIETSKHYFRRASIVID